MRHVLALLAGLLISAPLCAFEVKDNTIVLTDEEIEICTANEGCALITRTVLIGLQQRAHDTGLRECRNST